MSFLSKTRKYSLLGFVFVVLSLPLIGCGGVSEEEMSLLEQQRQAAVAAEKKLEAQKAEKARLEPRLADKQAEKKALEKEKAAVEMALAE
jgi:hypothetical protein